MDHIYDSVQVIKLQIDTFISYRRVSHHYARALATYRRRQAVSASETSTSSYAPDMAPYLVPLWALAKLEPEYGQAAAKVPDMALFMDGPNMLKRVILLYAIIRCVLVQL